MSFGQSPRDPQSGWIIQKADDWIIILTRDGFTVDAVARKVEQTREYVEDVIMRAFDHGHLIAEEVRVAGLAIEDAAA